jgi:hypothetical protein
MSLIEESILVPNLLLLLSQHRKCKGECHGCLGLNAPLVLRMRASTYSEEEEHVCRV